MSSSQEAESSTDVMGKQGIMILSLFLFVLSFFFLPLEGLKKEDKNKFAS